MSRKSLIGLCCLLLSIKADKIDADEQQDCVESCKEERQQERLGDHCYYWSAGPSGIKIFNPGIFGTGFCQIPGSRDFSGRDLPLFSIPGLFRNFTGIFRDFCFCFVCWSVIKSHNFHQSLSLSLSPPHPQEGSRMSAQHMKRLSQMLPQTLTN